AGAAWFAGGGLLPTRTRQLRRHEVLRRRVKRRWGQPARPTAATRKRDGPPPHRTWRRRTGEGLPSPAVMPAGEARDTEGNRPTLAHDEKPDKWMTRQQAQRVDVLAPQPTSRFHLPPN